MKTFDELRLQAEAIRDAVNENENTAERVGGHLLDTVEKMQSLDIGKVADAVLQAENAAAEAKEQAEIVGQASEVIEMAKEQGNVAAAQGNMAEAAAAAANAAADKVTNEGLFKTQQDLSEEEQGQVKRNLGIEDLMASLETQTIEGFSETVNATTSTKSVDNIILPSIDFAIVDLGSTDGRELPTAPTMSVVLAKVTDGGRVKMQGYLKTSHEEYNIQVISGSAEKYGLNVGIITDIETTYKVFQIRYLSSSDAGKFKGSYGELSQLQTAYPTASNGSYAFVGNPRHLYEWSSNAWTDRGEFTTSVDQAIDPQSERAIANKAVSAKLTELEGKTCISDNTDSDTALDVSDEIGNVVLRIRKNGHVATKKFDSEKQEQDIEKQRQDIENIYNNENSFPKIEDTNSGAALDISDEMSNVIMRITTSGAIKTKGFDSDYSDYKVNKLYGYNSTTDAAFTRKKGNCILSANVGLEIELGVNEYRSVLIFDVSKFNGRDSYLKITPTNINAEGSSHSIVITDNKNTVLFASSEVKDTYFINLALYDGCYYVYVPVNGNDGVISVSCIDNAVNSVGDEVFNCNEKEAEAVNSPLNYNIGISQQLQVGEKFSYEKNPYRRVYRYDVRGFNRANVLKTSGDDINVPIWVITDFKENVLAVGRYDKSVYNQCIDFNLFRGKACWLFVLNNEGLGKPTCILYSIPLQSNSISISDRMQLISEKPLGVIKETPGLTACFRTFGVIGDSFASGAMDDPGYNEDPDAVNFYEYSWMQYLARACNAKAAYNFSRGGETVKSWWNWDGGHIACGKQKDIQCYYNALGINDIEQDYDIGNFETDVDLENYNNNAETFIGLYCKIIQYVRSIKSDSYFFLVTLPTYIDTSDTEGRAYKICEAIRLISTKFERCYLIDQNKYAPYAYNFDFLNIYYLNTHMSPMGYMWMSYMIGTYTDWIMRNNPDEFKHLYAVTTENE